MRFSVSIVVVGLLIVCALCFVHSAFAVTHEDASGEVAGADQALRSAFRSVLDTEQSGANVSVLLPRLNEASSALTVAEEALTAGNYSGAAESADVCKSLANGVEGDAVVLKSDAVAAAGNWWVTVVLSVVGSVVFVGVLFVFWRRFRRGYVKRVLGSRPEVTG